MTSDEITAINRGNKLLTVHRIVRSAHESGSVDKATMRRFDEQCLTPTPPMGPEEIRSLREDAGLSQAVLAKIVNVTASTVFQWERGDKKPTGSALKLLALMRTKGVAAVL